MLLCFGGCLLPSLPPLLLLLPPRRQHMPDHAAAAALSVPLLCYEQLLDEAAESRALGSFTWPRLQEDSPAGLCYTSGTTGNPQVGCFPASNVLSCKQHVFLQAALNSLLCYTSSATGNPQGGFNFLHSFTVTLLLLPLWLPLSLLLLPHRVCATRTAPTSCTR